MGYCGQKELFERWKKVSQELTCFCWSSLRFSFLPQLRSVLQINRCSWQEKRNQKNTKIGTFFLFLLLLIQKGPKRRERGSNPTNEDNGKTKKTVSWLEIWLRNAEGTLLLVGYWRMCVWKLLQLFAEKKLASVCLLFWIWSDRNNSYFWKGGPSHRWIASYIIHGQETKQNVLSKNLTKHRNLGVKWRKREKKLWLPISSCRSTEVKTSVDPQKHKAKEMILPSSGP